MSDGLSRIGWVSFCGVKVTNLDFSLNAPKLISVNKPASPNMTYNTFTAPKRNGAKYYSNRYEDNTIEVTIGVHGTAEERQTAITNLLKQWIGKEDKLFFGDRPDLFYIARFFDSVATNDSGTFTEIAITFIASYCMYELYDDLRDYPVSDLTMKADSIGALMCSATWENISETTTKTINNGGNYEAKPIIKLDGIGTLVSITLNGRAFSITNLNGIIFVNCEDMTVYKMSDGKKVSCLPQFSGLFPVLSAGNNNCIISGTSMDINVTVDFRNTYIV